VKWGAEGRGGAEDDAFLLWDGRDDDPETETRCSLPYKENINMGENKRWENMHVVGSSCDSCDFLFVSCGRGTHVDMWTRRHHIYDETTSHQI